MPIVFAGVVPHSPLLVPEVSKDHQRLLASTQQSLNQLAEEIHAAQLDVTILLTPHGPHMGQAFVAQIDDHFQGNLAEFGNLTAKVEVPGAVGFGHRFKEFSQAEQIQLQLQTAPILDYGTTVPLLLLGPERVGAVLPISLVDQPTASIVQLGNSIYEFCQSRTERIGLLASADLSRRDRAALANPDANRPTKDERMIAEAVSAVDPSRLLTGQLEQSICGWAPILALLSSLQPLNAQGTIRSFEAPFGVGLLTAVVTIPR